MLRHGARNDEVMIFIDLSHNSCKDSHIRTSRALSMKADNFFGGDDTNADENIKDANEDRMINDMVTQALELAGQGQNVDALISSLPKHLQDRVKKRVMAAQQQKQATQRAAAAPDAKGKGGLRAVIGLMAKQAYDKITSTMKAKPDFQRKVQEAGKVLMRNGVIVDQVRVSELDLGNLAPSVGVAKDKDKTVQR